MFRKYSDRKLLLPAAWCLLLLLAGWDVAPAGAHAQQGQQALVAADAVQPSAAAEARPPSAAAEEHVSDLISSIAEERPVAAAPTAMRALPGTAPPAAVQEIRAGAASSVVTPPLGTSINGGFRDEKARDVHDELHARALVLDDGQVQMALVVVDNCMIPRDVYDAAKKLAHALTGIPREHMLMSATHTHSGGSVAHVFQSPADAAYAEVLTRRIADAVARAYNNLQPARVGWGAGQVPQHVHNRRWFVKDAQLRRNPFGGTDQVRMNPPAGSPELIEPAGPTDPTLSILSLQTQDGRPLALLANYSLHYVGGVPGEELSADYFGAFTARMEELLEAEGAEPSFVALMSNGTSGDINNVDFARERVRKEPYEQIALVARDVAEEALRVYRRIEHRAQAELGVRQTEIELGVRLPSEVALARATSIVRGAKGPVMQTTEEVYAREALFLADYPPTMPVLLQAVQIGDVAIAAIPCEVFVEIGLELRERSSFETTFTISLANGYNGYLPTPKHHKLGGYETWPAKSSYLEADASTRIVEALLPLFETLQGER